MIPNMKKHKISIVMATYNGVQFLEEQIFSLFNQTINFDELIIVDDCSNDETFILLNKIKDSDKRIYLFRNEQNMGVVKTFSKAISKSQGDYIFLCDQDDLWKENKIEYLISRIGSRSLIYSNAKIIDDKGCEFEYKYSDINNLFGIDSNSTSLFKLLTLHSFILGSSMMFKSELKKYIIPLMETHRNHDWWISYNAILCNGIKYTNECLLLYRFHENNLTLKHKKKSKTLNNSIELNKKLRRINDLEKIVNLDLFVDESEKTFLKELKEFIHASKTNNYFKKFRILYKYKNYFFPLVKNKIKLLIHVLNKSKESLFI